MLQRERGVALTPSPSTRAGEGSDALTLNSFPRGRWTHPQLFSRYGRKENAMLLRINDNLTIY